MSGSSDEEDIPSEVSIVDSMDESMSDDPADVSTALAAAVPSGGAVGEVAATRDLAAAAARAATFTRLTPRDDLAAAKRKRMAELRAEMLATGYTDPWAPDRWRGSGPTWKAANLGVQPGSAYALRHQVRGQITSRDKTSVYAWATSHHAAVAAVLATGDGLSDDSSEDPLQRDLWHKRAPPAAVDAVVAAATRAAQVASQPQGYSAPVASSSAGTGGTGGRVSPMEAALEGLRRDSTYWQKAKQPSSVRAPFQLGDEVVSLPASLADLPHLRNVLCEAVWHDVLSEEDRAKLLTLLPGESTEAKHATLQTLLRRENIHFGNPLERTEVNMALGNLHPVVAVRRRANRAAEQAQFGLYVVEHLRRLAASTGAGPPSVYGVSADSDAEGTESLSEGWTRATGPPSLAEMWATLSDADDESDSAAYSSLDEGDEKDILGREYRRRTRILAEATVDPDGDLAVGMDVLDKLPGDFQADDSFEGVASAAALTLPASKRPRLKAPGAGVSRTSVMNLAPGLDEAAAAAGYDGNSAASRGLSGAGLPSKVPRGSANRPGGAAASSRSSGASRKRSASAVSASALASSSSSSASVQAMVPPPPAPSPPPPTYSNVLSSVTGGAGSRMRRQANDAAPLYDTTHPIFPLFLAIRSVLMEGDCSFDELMEKLGDRLVREAEYYPALVQSPELVLATALDTLAHPPGTRVDTAFYKKATRDTDKPYDYFFHENIAPSQDRWSWVALDDPIPAEGVANLQRLEAVWVFAVTRGCIIKGDAPRSATVDFGDACRTRKTGWTELPVNCPSEEALAGLRADDAKRFDVKDDAAVVPLPSCTVAHAIVKNALGVEKTCLLPTRPIDQAATARGSRPHALLRAERPVNSSVVVLVQDALSRLPGGVGSRADVERLITWSAYVRPAIAAAAGVTNVLPEDGAEEDGTAVRAKQKLVKSLKSGVSSALDRLQTAPILANPDGSWPGPSDTVPDAQVLSTLRYDGELKLWMSLTRRATPEQLADTKLATPPAFCVAHMARESAMKEWQAERAARHAPADAMQTWS